MQSHSDYIEELSQDWLDETSIGCCMVGKNDAKEVPVSIAITSKREYRDGVRRPTKLNWQRKQTYLRTSSGVWNTWSGQDHRVRDVNKTPIMSLQVKDIGERALRKLRDSLMPRHEVAAAGASDVADAGDVGDTGDGEGDAGDGSGGDDPDIAGNSNSADEDSGNVTWKSCCKA